MAKNDTWEVKGEEVVAKIKEIIREGNARKVTIKDKSGEVLISFPLTVGVVGTMIAPVLAQLEP